MMVARQRGLRPSSKIATSDSPRTLFRKSSPTAVSAASTQRTSKQTTAETPPFLIQFPVNRKVVQDQPALAYRTELRIMQEKTHTR